MKNFLSIVGALLLMAIPPLTASADEKKLIPPVFVPYAITYIDGHLVNILPMKDDTDHLFLYETLKECMNQVQSAVEKSMMAGHTEEGHGLVGACMPAPSSDPTAPRVAAN